ncbi:hypothetical protein B0T26DRAFT_171176 [Lasiosphaeria miniovina]|uniref:Uncharacterized protein n=1 Tax=Lasiosphaeria miniovina TaxID=1954250 RepID=A0AA40E4Z9_9PEZI|nr:uncharacterized protein B0T26DRAFT_171176 [Lasiosphaeria miniovina]KAK0728419.1 hypothetical protein B0T26DRAFT_171176 [Lasiosphaeria miniovina]
MEIWILLFVLTSGVVGAWLWSDVAMGRNWNWNWEFGMEKNCRVSFLLFLCLYYQGLVPFISSEIYISLCFQEACPCCFLCACYSFPFGLWGLRLGYIYRYLSIYLACEMYFEYCCFLFTIQSVLSGVPLNRFILRHYSRMSGSCPFSSRVPTSADGLGVVVSEGVQGVWEPRGI